MKLLTLLAAFVSLAAAAPFNTTYVDARDVQRRAKAGDFYLRILPLGASIVWGMLSSDGNGFRKALRDELRFAGWEVNMVGTKNNGNMHDNNVEAHPGDVIDQINAAAQGSYKYLPNVVLINAGTNDCNANLDIANAHNRLGSMLDGLFNAIPDTTIIVSTLLPNTNQQLSANAVIYNANVRKMIADRLLNKGQKVVLAEMENGFLELSDIQDGTHPTDDGYRKMASVFWYSIQAALQQNFITAPKDNGMDDSVSETVCLKELGDTKTMLETQVGSGYDDGIYVHKSQGNGVEYTIVSEDAGLPHNFWFANILGSGMDDIIQFVSTSDGTAKFRVHKNQGGSFSELSATMDVGWFCNARGVRWGDFNGDGLDDFICIGPDGGASLSINNGGSPPSFTVVGLIIDNKEQLQDRVRLGDIDGDGRCDYCVLHDNGDIHCWRNGGNGLAPTAAYGGYWQDLGIVFTGKGMGDINGPMLVDINGDHRSDWLFMDTTGKVYTYTNSRFCNVDTTNFLLDWKDSGWTHGGMGVEGARDKIKFARFYGTTGKHSYVYITNSTTTTKGKYNYNFNVWANLGSGGTYKKADGNHYCDMRGTGADDYIWVGPDGSLTIFGNYHSYPNWLHYGEVFTVPNLYDRRSIHFADMNGDGKCDVLHVNTVTGATEVFRNDYNAGTDKFSFTYLGFQSGSISCTQGMGVGLRDLGVRFADIDGDGRADYLCIDPNGRTTGWLNQGGGSWKDVGQVKVSVGYDRANHRYVDVNGDGRADFIWINKFTGEVRVWLNQGNIPVPSLGSSFTWTDEGIRYAGHAQGHCMHYPNIGGLGLADMHYAHSTVNNAETWFNTCGGRASTNGDDGDIIDPKLEVFAIGGVTTIPGSHEVTTGGVSCVAGTGPSDPADLKQLCAFGCGYGVCPSPCSCLATGSVDVPPNGDGTTATSVSGQVPGVDVLCDFACARQYCPTDLCVVTGSGGGSGGGSGSGSGGDFPAPNPMCINGKPPAGYSNWPCISCSDNSVADTVAGADRWTAADADNCLSDIVGWFEAGETDGAVWPAYGYHNVVGQWAAYLNVTPNGIEPGQRDCFLDSSTCTTLNICEANVPAGALIFDSFHNLQHLFDSWYSALTDAAVSVGSDITNLADTFASIKVEDDTALKLTLDILALGYGQFAASIWNKVLKDAKYFTTTAARKNDHGWYKDATNNMVATSLTIAKDTGQAAQIKIDQVGELQNDLGSLFDTFQGFINDHLNKLFNGDSGGLSDLRSMLSGGVFVEQTDQSVNKATLKPYVEQILLSMLIPRAWELSTDVNPVILIQPGANNHTNPFTHIYNGGDGSQGSVAGANHWGLSDENADLLRVTSGDSTLYMITVHADMSINSAHVGMLPGIEELVVGNTDWQGLTFADMATSSFQGYQVNGNKNGYSIDSGNMESLLYTDGKRSLGDFAFQNAFATPGYYNIPACSVEEIVYNSYVLSHPPDDCEYFPCCGVTQEEIDEIRGGYFPGTCDSCAPP